MHGLWGQHATGGEGVRRGCCAGLNAAAQLKGGVLFTRQLFTRYFSTSSRQLQGGSLHVTIQVPVELGNAIAVHPARLKGRPKQQLSHPR